MLLFGTVTHFLIRQVFGRHQSIDKSDQLLRETDRAQHSTQKEVISRDVPQRFSAQPSFNLLSPTLGKMHPFLCQEVTPVHKTREEAVTLRLFWQMLHTQEDLLQLQRSTHTAGGTVSCQLIFETISSYLGTNDNLLGKPCVMPTHPRLSTKDKSRQ